MRTPILLACAALLGAALPAAASAQHFELVPQSPRAGQIESEAASNGLRARFAADGSLSLVRGAGEVVATVWVGVGVTPSYVRISPDGERVVAASHAGDEHLRPGVWLWAVRGHAVKQLHSGETPCDARAVAARCVSALDVAADRDLRLFAIRRAQEITVVDDAGAVRCAARIPARSAGGRMEITDDQRVHLESDGAPSMALVLGTCAFTPSTHTFAAPPASATVPADGLRLEALRVGVAVTGRVVLATDSRVFGFSTRGITAMACGTEMQRGFPGAPAAAYFSNVEIGLSESRARVSSPQSYCDLDAGTRVEANVLAISTDGRFVAVRSNDGVEIRDLDSATSFSIPGASQPVFDPSSQWLLARRAPGRFAIHEASTGRVVNAFDIARACDEPHTEEDGSFAIPICGPQTYDEYGDPEEVDESAYMRVHPSAPTVLRRLSYDDYVSPRTVEIRCRAGRLMVGRTAYPAAGDCRTGDLARALRSGTRTHTSHRAIFYGEDRLFVVALTEPRVFELVPFATATGGLAYARTETRVACTGASCDFLRSRGAGRHDTAVLAPVTHDPSVITDLIRVLGTATR